MQLEKESPGKMYDKQLIPDTEIGLEYVDYEKMMHFKEPAPEEKAISESSYTISDTDS